MSGNVKVESVEALLRIAQARIQNIGSWCTGHLALDSQRQVRGLTAKHPHASAWCALGALLACIDEHRSRDDARRDVVNDPIWNGAVKTLADVAVHEMGAETRGLADYSVIIQVNDGMGHTAVMEMFDRAIEIASGKRRLCKRDTTRSGDTVRMIKYGVGSMEFDPSMYLSTLMYPYPPSLGAVNVFGVVS